MTRSEARDILILRLDFKTDGAAPASSIYFEDVHPIVTLDNIKSSQPKADISEGDFEDYIQGLKESVINQVLSDALDKDEIEERYVQVYTTLFDNLISMQMQIKVINIILSSTRSNRTEALNSNSLQRIYFDLKGNKGSEKFPITDGIEHKYRSELRRVKNKIGDQRKFVSITTR